MSHQESPKHSVDVSDCYFYTNMLIIIKVTQKQQHIHKSHSFQYFRFTDISGSSLISYFILDLWPPEALRCGMQHYKWWWIKVGDGRWGDFMKNIIDGCGPLWGSQLSCSWKQFVSNKFEIALLQDKPELQRRQWHPTPVLLPGKSHGRRSLEGCSPCGRWGSDMTERLHFHFSLSCTGEGNGNPLRCSYLENPRDRGAWWAAVYGVAQSWTRLKWLSSSKPELPHLDLSPSPKIAGSGTGAIGKAMM